MKKRFILTIFISFLILLLTACGSSKDTTTTEESSDSNDDVTEISLWHMEEPPNRVERFQEVIDKFNSSQDKVIVNTQVLNWDEAYQQVLSAIQAGNRPDILFTIPDFTTTVLETDTIQDVSDLVEELDEKHNFHQSALDPYEYEGAYKAVPIYGMAYVLWYHKDVFDEAGLEPPTNYEEMLAAAEKLHTDDQYGIILPASKGLATDQQIYNFIIASGGADFAKKDGTIDFNNKKVVQAFQMYKDLAEYAPSDITEYGWGEVESGFATGRAAMALSFGNITGTYDSESGKSPDLLGAVPMPFPSDGEKGSIYYSNGAMVLSEEENKQEASKEFLRFLLEPETYGQFLNAEPALFLPVTEDAINSDSYRGDEHMEKYKKQVDVILEESEHGKLFGFTDGIFPDIGEISARNILSQAVQMMFTDDASPEEAVEWAQQEMESIAK